MLDLAFILSLIILFVVSFLLGSIPWGVIISKVFYKTDIRDHGSGNIGTTNAMRTMGKVGGSAVFVLDFCKGLLSGFLAYPTWWILQGLLGETPEVMGFLPNLLAIAFLGCVWGHIFSPWLGFKGGKGIAVAIGALFFTFGVIGACIELAIFIVLVVITRYVSVGSMAAAIACPILAAFWFLVFDYAPLAFIFCTIAGLTVFWAHRSNFMRLVRGEENRIGDKKKSRS